MKCPCCGAQDSRVLDSRPANEGTSIKRRRECPACGKRFTTYEIVDSVPIVVIKKDGSHEFFDEHKLQGGILRACQKRPVDAAAISAEIVAELNNALISEITTKEIGERVMEKLRLAPPATLGGDKVVSVGDYSKGYFTNTETGEKTAITQPASNVLYFVTASDDKVVIRPSGTEPKIKIYLLVHGRDEAEADAKVAALTRDTAAFSEA